MLNGLRKVSHVLGKMSDDHGDVLVGLAKAPDSLMKVLDCLGKVSDGLGMLLDGLGKVLDGLG